MPAIDTGAYFSEQAFDDVTGFVVMATDQSGEESRYHIAEKWLNPPSGDSRWIQYWIDQSALAQRVADGDCVQERTLDEDRLADIRSKYSLDFGTAAAASV